MAKKENTQEEKPRETTVEFLASLAAVLVTGAAAASGYFAHGAATPVVSGTTQPGTVVSGTGQKATVAHPVVTSGGSGVVVGQNGQASRAVAYRDN